VGNNGSLKKAALRGSTFELLGYGMTQALRLFSSLVLTRILFPEAFGLAALVAIFNQGLIMLSDVGVEQSVVHNERGDDPRFLNTAWVIHIVRGLILWLAACALAWPMAGIYEEPQLLYLLPVGALNVVIGGFASTSFFTLRRRLELGRLTWIDLISQVAGLAVSIPWALASPSIWAIVAGGLATAVVKTASSHLIDVGYRNKIEWDPHAKREIMNFGKWIFASSALSFVSLQSDRLLLGEFLGVAMLGIYSIAVMLTDSLATASNRITHGVMYPVFSRVQREEPWRMRNVYYKVRLALDGMSLLPIGVLAVLAHDVVELLYDDRYKEAGWMAQALCMRIALSCVLVPAETLLFSLGQTQYGLYRNIGRAVWILVGVPLGYYFWGIQGVVWATATSELPVLIILWIPLWRRGLLRLSREALAIVLLAAGVIIGLALDDLIAPLVTQFKHH
jgi:O-antigen/teichoic acid export membrane protein